MSEGGPWAIDISGMTCPCCPHLNGEHDDYGKCGECVCKRTLVPKIFGAGKR